MGTTSHQREEETDVSQLQNTATKANCVLIAAKLNTNGDDESLSDFGINGADAHLMLASPTTGEGSPWEVDQPRIDTVQEDIDYGWTFIDLEKESMGIATGRF
ncbi:conserved hypothetical protein [Ricinus communis]|uniref:Uncharacterized protein n=1 Tax=Ricinus communis TaxID=3988 RepID=B9RB27_RICCO|nr:conserved hypothetical protein [Ricinus communis]